MLILAAPFGDNSNRFFQHIHLDAYCASNGISFVNPHLNKYAEIFPRIAGVEGGRAGYSVFFRLFPKIFGADLIENKAWIRANASKTRYVKGWGFRAYDEVIARRSYYRSLFTPSCDAALVEKMQSYKAAGSVLAVHLRRGDYRKWQGGRYHYSDQQYVEIIQRSFETCKEVGTILLFSNEVIDIGAYCAMAPNVVAISANWYEEQWLMSLSDYIVGPPSTFSAWASFVGNVPLWHVSDFDASVAFSVCDG